jgi:hypothetical protein
MVYVGVGFGFVPFPPPQAARRINTKNNVTRFLEDAFMRKHSSSMRVIYHTFISIFIKFLRLPLIFIKLLNNIFVIFEGKNIFNIFKCISNAKIKISFFN